MIRLFIEGHELDVAAGFTQQITYAIDDLNNLDSKSTAFSKTIILPGTTNNNKLLGNIFNQSNSNFTNTVDANVGYNFNASRAAKARIDSNGLTVIKGVLRLLEIIVDDNIIEYEVAVFGELGGLFAKLGNSRLSDLDFSAYNHEYSAANFVASWTHYNDGEGYYYPLIDYGNVSVDKINYNYRAFRPALFLREYLDKIITGAGYTWQSDFCDTFFFKRLIIPNNQKRLQISKTQAFSGNYGQNFAGSGFTVIFYTGLTINTFTGGTFTTSDNIEFEYTGSAATLIFNAVINGSYANNNSRNSSIKIMLYKNTDIIEEREVMNGQANGGFNAIFTGINIDFATSDVFSIRILAFSTFPLSGTFNIGIDPTSNIRIESAIPILLVPELGDTINMNEVLPSGIFQRDLFATILKLFNLLVNEDKLIDKHLIITPWVDFYSKNPATYEDWTGKVDWSKPLKYKPMSEVNARFYECKYKSDNDFYNENYRKKYNEGYGDRVFDNGLDFAKDSEKVEVIFAATPLVGYTGVDKVVSTIFKKTNGIEDSIDHVLRLMQAKNVDGITLWEIRADDGSALASNTEYGYAGHYDDPDVPGSDILFGSPQELYFELAAGALSNNLFNAFYSSYLAEITDKDSRLLSCKMKLTQQDIYDLNFSNYKYINGGLYRLVKVIDWSEDELCNVELLRVINTVY